MFKFLNLNPEIFGIDINDLSLRIVKLKKKRKGFALVSFNEVDIAPGIVKEGVIQNQPALVKIIKAACETVKGKKLNTKHVLLSLPEEKSFSQVIQMPRMTQKELELAVPFEAENYIPLTIDKVYLDFQVINSHKKDLDHMDLLINVMPKTVVDSYVSCFKAAGLMPSVLELESQSITRALLKEDAKESQIIFLDLGIANTNLIIYSGNSIRFTCSLPISSWQLTDAIAKKLNMSFAEAEDLKIKYGLMKEGGKKYDVAEAVTPLLKDMAAQIRKYISFYRDYVAGEYAEKGADSIEKIVLCGGGANLKQLPEFLSKELKIYVEIGNPFINIIPPVKNKKFIPYKKALSFTTVLGLALRGAMENDMPA